MNISKDLPEKSWQQGAVVELAIADLTDEGDGVGRVDGQVVFVPDTVPGDRVQVRLVRVKPQYAHGKLLQVLEASDKRIRPHCIVADKCGGCEWQHINYDYQSQAKQRQVIQALERIGGFVQPTVNPLLAVEATLGYRNKATFPLGRSKNGQVQAGYYQKGSHDLINLNQCPIQDAHLNPILAGVKRDIQERGWSIYQEEKHQGKLRHLSLRIGRRTGEVLLTLVTTDWNLPELEEQAEAWLKQYPELVGVCVNRNRDRTNAIFGKETRYVAGRPYLREKFAGLEFHISPTTFFQVNTEQAESLLRVILQELQLQGTETLVDAYAGVGTLTLPLARKVKQAIAVELQSEAVEQAQENAALNQIRNIQFEVGAVEKVLPTLEVRPEIVLLDPPRKGCDRVVLETLLDWQPERIVYVSCKPATLSRDLKILCEGSKYQLTRVQPADFFPQTPHVECVAFLTKVS